MFVHKEFPGKLESTNLSLEFLSVETGRVQPEDGRSGGNQTCLEKGTVGPSDQTPITMYITLTL